MADDTPDDDRIERATRIVPADSQEIFDLLADPAGHALIDGSGTVRGSSSETPERLSLGAKFGMSMKAGVPYRITNTVVEFDEPSVIAWRHMGGHVWRYRLRPVEGGTEVTEEFDWRTAKSATMLKLMGAPKKNARAIEATLDRMVDHFSTP